MSVRPRQAQGAFPAHSVWTRARRSRGFPGRIKWHIKSADAVPSPRGSAAGWCRVGGGAGPLQQVGR
eukprot:34388-Eustigmatos_ZCMA.PRE.1